MSTIYGESGEPLAFVKKNDSNHPMIVELQSTDTSTTYKLGQRKTEPGAADTTQTYTVSIDNDELRDLLWLDSGNLTIENTTGTHSQKGKRLTISVPRHDPSGRAVNTFNAHARFHLGRLAYQ